MFQLGQIAVSFLKGAASKVVKTHLIPSMTEDGHVIFVKKQRCTAL